MQYLKSFRDGLLAGRYNVAIVAFAFAFVILLVPGAAWAQAGNPFKTAESAAGQVRDSFKSFALVVGAIGMISCLLLGFFGKLNWKWVATGIGVSFALAIVVPAISWLDSLNG